MLMSLLANRCWDAVGAGEVRPLRRVRARAGVGGGRSAQAHDPVEVVGRKRVIVASRQRRHVVVRVRPDRILNCHLVDKNLSMDVLATWSHLDAVAREEPPRLGLWLDTSRQPAEESADEILRRAWIEAIAA